VLATDETNEVVACQAFDTVLVTLLIAFLHQPQDGQCPSGSVLSSGSPAAYVYRLARIESPAAYVAEARESNVPVPGSSQRAPMSTWSVSGSVQSPWKPMFAPSPASAIRCPKGPSAGE